MTKMEEKIKAELQIVEIGLRTKTERLAELHETAVNRAQMGHKHRDGSLNLDVGDWLIHSGKEIMEMENEIRQLREKRKMLEYFLNDKA